jgi:ribosomal protein S18 acetylase RimI-like enzyme
MTDDYALDAGVPAVAEFCHLRRIAGMTERSAVAAAAGLPNSWFAVLVRQGGVAVGMGRIIGDGGLVFQIVDIAVDPAHQRRGLGKAIMARLMAELRARAPGEAYVSLIADGDARHLYGQFGLAPVMPESIGMAMWLTP